ncbi:hypothetical protein EMA8858_00944 [Emticicia aquatica]|jgi:hypothetical protein|uniref:Uncharacterized protein n=1 Tax=Emticicia aquatica TaxID=1681835 RepID=A0ABM9AM18_9BACT|nr:hypothetical protein EMA8858_00944 [Emticicia aquatica]
MVQKYRLENAESVTNVTLGNIIDFYHLGTKKH